MTCSPAVLAGVKGLVPRMGATRGSHRGRRLWAVQLKEIAVAHHCCRSFNESPANEGPSIHGIGLMPKVSIGIPLFNEARYIKATIACLKNQTLDDFEVIIADNCSSDGTYELCQAEINGDSRFKILKHPKNIGGACNFDYVYRCARANYFMWLGGHDLITDTTLYSLSGILDKNDPVSMAMAWPCSIGENGDSQAERSMAIYDFSAERDVRYLQSVELLFDCTIFHSMFRTEKLKQSPMKPIISYDHILISRLLWHGNIQYCRECSYIRRETHSERPQMETITGDRSTPVSRYDFARAYVSDFQELYDGDIKDRQKLCAEILKKLVNRFGPSCLRDARVGQYQSDMEYLLNGNSPKFFWRR
jgi:glycosyltransferase involved in cell wall biosynthesis